MPPERPRFYYDCGSPYAYLAASRIGDVLPQAEWQPIALMGLFKLNGRDTWAFDAGADARRAEIDERAAAYGLPPVAWQLPSSLLPVMRAATVARRSGREVEFSLAAFRAAWVDGRDLASEETLAALAPKAGLGGDELLAAIGEQDVKDELRCATEQAHALGVPGVPSVVVGTEVIWGDDRLEEAAIAAS
jgi:2-hydroxychromene-2-carboxylate isomerase